MLRPIFARSMMVCMVMREEDSSDKSSLKASKMAVRVFCCRLSIKAPVKYFSNNLFLIGYIITVCLKFKDKNPVTKT